MGKGEKGWASPALPAHPEQAERALDSLPIRALANKAEEKGEGNFLLTCPDRGLPATMGQSSVPPPTPTPVFHGY